MPRPGPAREARADAIPDAPGACPCGLGLAPCTGPMVEAPAPSPTPTVSVVVTVYRRTDYLRSALESALGQTLRDIEVIVTDDSASAPIRAIVEGMGDARLRYRANTPTLGVALNVRAALLEARGRYVSILNDDDLWEPDFLQRLVEPLEQDPRRTLAFCDHWIIDAHGRVDEAATAATTQRYHRDRLVPGDHDDPKRLVLEWNAVPLAMGSVFRRDALPASALVPEVVGAYDYWISVQLAALDRPFYFHRDRLTRYRSHPTMETGRRSPEKSENGVYVHRMLLADARFASHAPLLRRRLADALVESAKDRLLFDQRDAARQRFAESWRVHRSARAAAGLLATYAPSAFRRSVGITLPSAEPQLASGRQSPR